MEGFRYLAEALVRLYETSQPCNSNTLISIAPFDEAHAANRARWVKFAILLYNYDFELGHCLLDHYMPSEAILNPETTTDSSIKDFLPWRDLETAHFRSIYLTHTGTVLYLGYHGPYMLVDEEGLRNGRLTMVEYEINGAVKNAVQICPFNMRMPHMYASVLGKRLDDIRHVPGGYRHQNLPLDMDRKIINILFQAKAAGKLPEKMDLYDREEWMIDIEIYAPGYLVLEVEGRAGEYPLHRLTVPDSIRGLKQHVLNRAQSDPRFILNPHTFP